MVILWRNNEDIPFLDRVWSSVRAFQRGIYWLTLRRLSRRTKSASAKMIYAGKLLLTDYWGWDTTLQYASLAGKDPPHIPPVISVFKNFIFYLARISTFSVWLWFPITFRRDKLEFIFHF